MQSVHTSYKRYVLIEILTNYIYSPKYLPMYPLCISITTPDKGHTSSTPRGQYFSKGTCKGYPRLNARKFW